MGNFEIVCFDVETTGFSNEDEIIQIAAFNGNSFFNVYITPTRPLDWKTSQITGLELRNRYLYLRNKKLYSISADNAFSNFMNYLRRFNRKIILVAHNCFGFDMPRIIKLASELNFLNQFQQIIHGFSDSLVILRTVLNERRAGRGKFTLKALVKDFQVRVPTNNLHNARYDAEALHVLLFKRELGISEDIIIQWSKSIDQYFSEDHIKLVVTESRRSLKCYKNFLAHWLINKMAKNMINRGLLIDSLQQNGFEGVKRLLAKNHYGRPCVTKNTKIISKVCNVVNNDIWGNL